MKMPRFSTLLMLSAVALSQLPANPALAVLGEKSDSIAKDGTPVSSVRRVLAANGTSSYQVQEVQTAATRIREYVTPSGVVFAVAWNGINTPDLSSLLGSYHQDYQTAKKQTPRIRGRRQQQVQGTNVVVETWGHMRNLQGRAYIPAMVPTGVNVNDLR
ncbi:hypothetical protein GMSM_07180 [Geomonas sp. Red276]